MKIGELAKKSGIQIETIRYYEKEGLLPAPDRNSSNYRIYSHIHEERLMFIKRCRSLDMSLEEIKVLLDFRDAPETNCTRVNTLIDEHIGHVTQRMEELRLLETQLRELRNQCADTGVGDSCGIIHALSSDTFPLESISHTGCGHIPHSHGGKKHA